MLGLSPYPNYVFDSQRRRFQRKSLRPAASPNPYTFTHQNLANKCHQFGSIIIEGFGFSTLNTLLVQIIVYVFQGVLVHLSTAGCSWFENSRTYWMVWNSALSIGGAAMARQITPNNVWARFMGYCLANAYSVNFPLTLAMSTGNIGGFTKKTTVNALV